MSQPKIKPPYLFSVAPMLDWTDRHCRYFLRLISRRALLYSEMVTSGALLHGDHERHLAFDPAEHPLALQIGGSDPAELAQCARIAADYGYDEINLNVGCPSDRVQSGRFGACLMAEPERVRDCLGNMQQVVDIPVSVKHRVGIDRDDSEEQLHQFVETVSESGISRFIVHARKAWLDGLSPKENRDVPPLRYDAVHRLKQQFPQLDIIINGGLQSLEQAEQQLTHVDGVMLGRAVYHNPWLLADVDRRFFGQPNPLQSPHEVIEQLLPYVERQLAQGAQLKHISRHMLGLFQGMPGARAWRRQLSQQVHDADQGIGVIIDAASHVAR